MSAENSLHQGRTVPPVSSVVEMPWIFSRSGEYPLVEVTPPKNVTDSHFMAHLLLLKMSPSFWAMLNRFMILVS